MLLQTLNDHLVFFSLSSEVDLPTLVQSNDTATAAVRSGSSPLVVSGAFLATQPCNLVVLGVIIPSLFIVIVA